MKAEFVLVLCLFPLLSCSELQKAAAFAQNGAVEMTKLCREATDFATDCALHQDDKSELLEKACQGAFEFAKSSICVTLLAE